MAAEDVQSVTGSVMPVTSFTITEEAKPDIAVLIQMLKGKTVERKTVPMKLRCARAAPVARMVLDVFAAGKEKIEIAESLVVGSSVNALMLMHEGKSYMKRKAATKKDTAAGKSGVFNDGAVKKLADLEPIWLLSSFLKMSGDDIEVNGDMLGKLTEKSFVEFFKIVTLLTGLPADYELCQELMVHTQLHSFLECLCKQRKMIAAIVVFKDGISPAGQVTFAEPYCIYTLVPDPDDATKACPLNAMEAYLYLIVIMEFQRYVLLLSIIEHDL